MKDSFLLLTVVILGLIIYFAIPSVVWDKELKDNPKKTLDRWMIPALLLILLLSLIPWCIADLTESSIMWPRLFFYAVAVVTCLLGWFIYHRKK